MEQFIFNDANVGAFIRKGDEARPALYSTAKPEKLVSCVMVTRGNLNILRHSVNCFLNQSYQNRELVVVLRKTSPEVESYFSEVKENALVPIRVFVAPGTLSLGDRRNMSIARSQGVFICTWDDDDLHHPRFLEFMVGYIMANRVGAAFLNQLTIWWPARKRFAHSKLHYWEQTMVARRGLVPIYPDSPKREDTFVKTAIAQQHLVALVVAPHL
ncbi:MAG: glycosyltransferase [Hyphomicrobiales bacterium]